MSETDATRTIWPSYALRAWLGALLSQTSRARENLETRIDAAEKEVARLRRQHERSGSVIESLQVAISHVDARLRQIRDTELAPSPEEHSAPAHKEPERLRRGQARRREEHGAPARKEPEEPEDGRADPKRGTEPE